MTEQKKQTLHGLFTSQCNASIRGIQLLVMQKWAFLTGDVKAGGIIRLLHQHQTSGAWLSGFVFLLGTKTSHFLVLLVSTLTHQRQHSGWAPNGPLTTPIWVCFCCTIVSTDVIDQELWMFLRPFMPSHNILCCRRVCKTTSDEGSLCLSGGMKASFENRTEIVSRRKIILFPGKEKKKIRYNKVWSTRVVWCYCVGVRLKGIKL